MAVVYVFTATDKIRKRVSATDKKKKENNSRPTRTSEVPRETFVFRQTWDREEKECFFLFFFLRIHAENPSTLVCGPHRVVGRRFRRNGSGSRRKKRNGCGVCATVFKTFSVPHEFVYTSHELQRGVLRQETQETPA